MITILTEEQRLLADSFATWLGQHHDAWHAKRLHPAAPIDDAIWQAWAELGWLGLGLPESDGGLGADLITCGLLMASLGRHQATEPVLACLMEAGQLLARAGNPQQRAHWLPRIISGECRLAMAHREQGMPFPWSAPRTLAVPEAGGWRLNGRKHLVRGNHGAAAWIVSASEADGRLRVFVMDPDTPGLVLHPCLTAGHESAADAALQDVWLGPDRLLDRHEADDGALQQAFTRTLAESVILGCWEMSGTMSSLLAQTIDYTRQRQQFGKSLADFQVVQHRLAEMHIHCTEARTACELASMRLTRDPDTACLQASMAHGKVARAARQVSQQAVQLHGAMGVCEELPVAAGFRHVLGMVQRAGGQTRHAIAYGREAHRRGLIGRSGTLPESPSDATPATQSLETAS